jgi:8-oxo-dGTP pyrophosphatase MutT (NUDIX family)
MEEHRPGPAELPNFGPPSTPRPAASIVLLRRGGKHKQRALEVLMLQRGHDARFMPSVWVFPGGSVETSDGEGEDGARACAVRELHEEAAIALPADEELVPFARWITPEVVSTRFDARFYLALAPAHTPPKVDGSECVDARWFEPRKALDAAERGEISLAFPTINQLGDLAAHETSDDALSHYRNAPINPIMPVVIGDRKDFRVLLPGDPNYPD